MTPTGRYLRASLEEKTFESRAGAHQGLDAVLGDLVAPGDVELLQEGTTLTAGGWRQHAVSVKELNRWGWD